MKCIRLTRGHFAMVDNEDYEWLSKHLWSTFKGTRNETFYAVRSCTVDGKKRTIWMHREINKTPEDLFTDHINGNGLDNRRCNLRTVTHAQNMVNNDRYVGRGRPRGVSWHKRQKRWVAQITIDYKNNHIGSFATAEEAGAAYEKRRAELRAGQIYRR